MASVKIKRFLALLDIQEKPDKLTVYYNKKSLLTIRTEALKQLIVDTGSKDLKDMFFDQFQVESTLKQNAESPVIAKALVLVNEYTLMKKKFYGIANASKITKSSKEFPDFVKAYQTILSLQTTSTEFLAAQVKGLEFANNGNGAFPKPSMLHGANAEDRFFNYRKSKEDKSLKEHNQKPIYITAKDKETALMENPRFVEAYEKVKDGKATMAEAEFVKLLMIERKGKATSMVLAYIKKLKSS